MFKQIHEYIQRSKTERQLHLRLNEPCVEIGGDSQNFRGTLAFYLKTTIPSGRLIHLCHACNNAKCSNPLHLYWGTAKENQDDCKFGLIGTLAAAKKRKENPIPRIWINNGNKSALLIKGQQIPVGWKTGRITLCKHKR